MAGITATGVGSGLDIESLVSQLMTIESRPLSILANKEASYQAKLSGYGQIKSALSSLQTATKALGKTDTFTAAKAAVSGEGFSASPSAGAASGSYSVEVMQMAKIQRVSTPTDSTFVPSAGKITIDYGTVTDSGGSNVFVDDVPARTASLEFEGSTLEELRDAINGNSTLGIKASIVNNGTEDQLVLSGTKTGANMAFKITGEGGLADLSYDPAATPAPSDTMYSVQTAQDARIKVDGIELTRGKNDIADVIDGVTLTLTNEPSGTVSSLKGTVTISSDQSAAKTAVEAFVKAYNDVADTLKNLTAYNTDTKTASTLTGDSTARSIQTQLRAGLGAAFSGFGSVSTLSQVGISFAKDGTLSFDNSKLSKAMNDPESGVASLFAGKDGVDGFAATFSSRLDNFLDSDGVLASRTEGINSTIKSITKQYDTLETRLTATEARYRAQFTKLDSLLSSLNDTSTYLTQQFSTKSSNN
ncbi:flagellar filament capping protein FliD [Azoarcus sp. L1K30]|uniref:flagellar filament capping protein FliD n=1 Tax=Azoarcus sp. L1K30 TaxID=2820277 RepID=UPI001B826C26|nr:flagellar filament capping protein FliD [Azoarcus sp. L1K30]MBR0564543.1 flagellar filament capping protein FliD [Azoarcus sp. L1K30]